MLITNFIQILNKFGFRFYPCVWNNVNNDCYEQIRNEFLEKKKNSEKNDQEQGVINVNISADLLLLFVWYYGKLY